MRGLAVLVVLGACGRAGFDPRTDAGVPLDPDTSLDPVPAMCGGQPLPFVPAIGRIEADVAALPAENAGSCGGADAEAVYAVDVVDGASLLVAADLPGTTADTAIYVRRECTDIGSEIVCDSDGGRDQHGAYRIDAPGAGRYYVFLDSDDATGMLVAQVQTLLPAGASCSAANGRDVCGPELACVAGTCQAAGCAIAQSFMLAPSASMTLDLDTSTAVNHHAGSCGQGNDGGARANERILTITLTGPSRLRVDTDDAMTSYDTLVYVRAACDGAEVGCDDDSGSAENRALLTTGTLAPGTYHVFVDGFAYTNGNARVTLTALP